jgi:hypothetical protein
MVDFRSEVDLKQKRSEILKQKRSEIRQNTLMNSRVELNEELSVSHQSWTDTNNSDCAGSPTERNVI